MKVQPNLSSLPAEKLHQLGSQEREKDNHLLALQYLDCAIISYQTKGDYEGIVDVLKDRTLTWKHYFLITGDMVYAILARKDAEGMLSISMDKKLNNKLGTSFFRLGEVDMLNEDYESAIKNYREALENYSGIAAEKGDYRYHLGEAYFRNGKKAQGKKVILEGIKEIVDNTKGVDDFSIHVWLSGAYLRLADLLKDDDCEKAKSYLKKAEEIILKDERLVIRKRQLDQVMKSFKS